MLPHLLAAALPTQVALADYPELQWLAWNRPKECVLAPDEAFALYERNWHLVDQNRLTDTERTLINQLIATIGRGVFLV